jgi:hypothetical protein
VEKTHGKQNLCRAFYFRRTAKSLFAVRFCFVTRRIKNARQSARYKTNGKDFDARQTSVFP